MLAQSPINTTRILPLSSFGGWVLRPFDYKNSRTAVGYSLPCFHQMELKLVARANSLYVEKSSSNSSIMSRRTSIRWSHFSVYGGGRNGVVRAL